MTNSSSDFTKDIVNYGWKLLSGVILLGVILLGLLVITACGRPQAEVVYVDGVKCVHEVTSSHYECDF